MNLNWKITVVAVGILALIGTIAGLRAPSSEPVDTSGLVAEIQAIKNRLGASPGGDFPGPEISIAGLHLWGRTVGIASGTSTYCAIQAPPSASSTLVAAFMRPTSQATTTNGLTVAVGKNALTTTQPATTTLLATTTIPAGVKDSVINALASTSAMVQTTGVPGNYAQAQNDLSFQSNQWLTFKAISTDGLSMSGNLASGTCSALWMY